MPAWAEYFQRLRWTGKSVADFAPWHRLAAVEGQRVEGVIRLKRHAGLLRSYLVHGLDWAGVTKEEQGGRMLAASDALRKLGGEWTMHAEARRLPIPTLPPLASPYEAARLLHADRCAQMLTAPGLWMTCYFLSLTWEPEPGQAQSIPEFVTAADECLDNMQAVLAQMRPLTTAEQLSYLHSTVSDTLHDVAVPEEETDLDLYLCDADWDSGAWREWDATLGQQHLRVLSLTGYPAQSWAGMMRSLDALPLTYRWGTRWTKIAEHLQDGILKHKQKGWADQEWSLGQKLWGSSIGAESTIANEDVVRKAADLSGLRQEIGADVVGLGHFVTTIITQGETADAADVNARRITQTLQRYGFVVRREGAPKQWFPTHAQAWFAAQPGNTLQALRGTVQTSLVAAHLTPGLQAAWGGPASDAHLTKIAQAAGQGIAGPWFVAQTEGHSLFRVVNHVEDLGLEMNIGPTGAGKSTFLWLKAFYWTQYHNAQIAAFDLGKAGRLPTLLLGGQWYDLAELRFQPLRYIDTDLQREEAEQWLLDLCEHSNVPEEGGKVRMYLKGGLRALAEATRDRLSDRTLSTLTTLLAQQTRGTELRHREDTRFMDLVAVHNKVRNVLLTYVGGVLDGTADPFSDHPVHTFEMARLVKLPRLARPVLTHINARITDWFDTERPTYMPMDEFAMQMLLPTTETQWHDLLMGARKRNVSLSFFIHNLEQVFSSPLGPLLIDSCKTRYFFPNSAATAPYVRKYYEQLDLVPEEIQSIKTLRRYRDIYSSCEETGKRVIHVPLSQFALDMLARNTDADHAVMDRLVEQYGVEGFQEAWLAERGWEGRCTEAEPVSTGYPAAAGG